MNKKAQVTIFVIIAILIILGALVVYIYRDEIFNQGETKDFPEVYGHFQECIELRAEEGLEIAGMQGGYVEVPEFEPGSNHAPFSSQLDFLGTPVPYWYYVSGNGVIKEQIPSLSKIENQLEDYIESGIKNCDFSQFRNQGMVVESDVNTINVRISDRKVVVNVNSDLFVQKDESQSRKTTHQVDLDSNFGSLYNEAVDFYEKEKETAMIENYTMDVLFNYAPVTGTEISCAPEVWNPREVVSDLRDGISSNINSLKVKGDYYDLDEEDNEYFVMDAESDFDVNFMYDKDWPTRIEVWPVENDVMVAEPVGLQKGLGVLGFCYVPYHFVYDISHPVLVQFSDGEEMLQFPLSVVIDKNNPRNSLAGTTFEDEDEMDEFCKYGNTDFTVYTYDASFEPVEAEIDFRCLNEECSMGKTEVKGGEARLNADFPQCANGIVKASAEDYVASEKIASTTSSGSVDVVLNKLYDLDLELSVGEGEISEDDLAVVRFEGSNYGATVVYPQQDEIKLSEDVYNVSVRVFSGSSFTLPESEERNCVEVPKEGLFNSLFGKTEEQCFNVEIPEREISHALTGGGENVFFPLQRELESASKIKISAGSLPSPDDLIQLQTNYDLLESNSLEVYLR